MKFADFVKYYSNTPIIDSSTFSHLTNPEHLRRQVCQWVLKKYMYPLKKGLYVFSKEYQRIPLSDLFVANFMVTPSYVSLEYAMGRYGLIPEHVSVITSVTTKKTKRFENCLGVFEYRSIGKSLFFGMQKETINNQEIFIASPEKAVTDYFYFNPHLKNTFSYFDSIRFQNLEILKIKRLLEYSKKYNKRTSKIIINFELQPQHLLHRRRLVLRSWHIHSRYCRYSLHHPQSRFFYF